MEMKEVTYEVLATGDKMPSGYYMKADVDAVLAEKDKEIALLKERICNGDVSRLIWIDDCIAKDKEIEELKKKLMPCLNGDCILTCEVVEKYGKENAELRQKLEDAKARVDYFVKAGVPKESFKIYTYELKEADK